MAIEQLLIAGVGLGLNLFGAGQEEKAANDIIDAQYEQAKRQWEFQVNDRNDLYNYEMSAVNAARQNNQNEIAYREAIDLQNWNNQVQINTDDYNAKVTAYGTSIEDYETQIGINQTTEDLALAQTKQKFFDQKTALGFQKREQISQQLGQYNQLVTQLSGAQNAMSDAIMQETIAETQALRDRDQSYDQLNYQQDRVDEQKQEVRNTGDIQNKALQERVNASVTDRDSQLLRLDQAKRTDALDTQNQIDSINLQRDQTIAKEQLGLTQTTGSANLDSDIARDQASMQISNARDAFGDATLTRDQQIAELNDRLNYNTFNRDSELGDLTDQQLRSSFSRDTELAELNDQQLYNLFNRDAELGDLSFEQSSAKLQYEQQRAARAFQQQSNHIEKLVNEGNAGAAGRQGLSAARSINNVLAAAGRQSAQLTDSIMRDSESYANITGNINRKKGVVVGRSNLTANTLNRKKGESTASAALTDDSLNRKKGVTIGRANLTEKTLERNKTEADAILDRARLDQNRAIDQAKLNRDNQIAGNDLTISQATQNSNLNIAQAATSASQRVNDLSEARSLRDFQSINQAEMVNKEFTNAFDSLTVEQELLADNLNKQLAAYGFETGSLNQQKEFTRQNYNVAIQSAAEVHDSALRRYNTSTAAVDMERDRLNKQNELIEDQYQASIASAEQAKLASESGIALDRYSADVTADKAVLPEPIQAPNPPAPIKYPETIYMDPRKPLDLPEPEKGPGAVGNYVGAFGSFVTNVGGIDWS
jgi:hypothetical protein